MRLHESADKRKPSLSKTTILDKCYAGVFIMFPYSQVMMASGKSQPEL